MLTMRLLLSAVLLPLLPTTAAAQRRTVDPRGRGISLVVVIAVDQLRPDYLRTFDRQFTGGFRRLIDRAVLYERGQQYHAITETAPGHAAMLSGRSPSSTGIVNNEHGVEDAAAPFLGNPQALGASPRYFRGTALYDWMLTRDPEVRQLAVSRKDRGAILMTGGARGQVYWFHDGRFSTSRYYTDALPPWVEAFNARRSAERLAGTTWDLLLPPAAYGERDALPFEHGGRDVAFPHRLPATAEETARLFSYYPWMDSLTAEFALEGVRQLELGRRARPDLLTVSFSTTDAVGHDYGPDSRELHDHLLRLDRWLGGFLDSLAVLVPAERTVVALTSDHGVQPMPEWSRANGRPARRIWLGDLAAGAGTALARRYRRDFGLVFDSGLLFADRLALQARGISVDSLASTLAAAARGRPGIRRVFTPESLRAAPVADREATLWKNQLPSDLGWLLCAAIEPGFVWSPPGRTIAEHGSTAELDVLVPIAFMGPGLRPARIRRPVRTVDIGPTLAALLGIRPTQPVEGQVLPEVAGRR
ncbi:MAG: alkaline phosphatase family protein [Gemmatimonadales bacterium]|nr:alkaline phosphatase family protein [Gemmatimonadales bacterium]